MLKKTATIEIANGRIRMHRRGITVAYREESAAWVVMSAQYDGTQEQLDHFKAVAKRLGYTHIKFDAPEKRRGGKL